MMPLILSSYCISLCVDLVVVHYIWKQPCECVWWAWVLSFITKFWSSSLVVSLSCDRSRWRWRSGSGTSPPCRSNPTAACSSVWAESTLPLQVWVQWRAEEGERFEEPFLVSGRWREKKEKKWRSFFSFVEWHLKTQDFLTKYKTDEAVIPTNLVHGRQF